MLKNYDPWNVLHLAAPSEFESLRSDAHRSTVMFSARSPLNRDDR